MGGRERKSLLDSRGMIIAISLALSLCVHAGVVLVAPRNPPPPVRSAKKIQKPVPVSIRKEQIKKIEKEVATEAEPKPPEKKIEPPKPPERKPPEKKPEPAKPPVDRPPPKAAETPPATPPPPADNKPKPFVLKNVALKGGVAVQTGEDSNLFGDPSVDAKGFKKGIDAPTAPGTEGGDSGGVQAQKEQVAIRQPRALNDVKGEYPPEYRDLRRVVRVELMLTVDAQGGVKDVKVRKGAEPEFNESAIRAVRQLRFEPATRNGTPIAFNLKWTVVFIPEGN